MNIQRQTVSIILLVGLLIIGSCKKSEVSPCLKTPEDAIEGTYNVTASENDYSSAPPFTQHDTTYGTALISISNLGNGVIKFTDNQLLNHSFEIGYSAYWSDIKNCFFWGEPSGNNISYYCETDTIRVAEGYHTTPHTEYTYWIGKCVSH